MRSGRLIKAVVWLLRSSATPVTRYAPRIGCAGWSIPAEVREHFAAGESVLARYATRFNAVEINSSFYRPHRRETYQRWAATVPDDFVFSVKMPRTITHDARLQNVGKLLDPFLAEVAGLAEKLEVILVQLPPSLDFDSRQAAAFLAALKRRYSGRVALEARHASWFTSAAGSLLKRHGVARVAADPAIAEAAVGPGGCLDWAYWRLHGSPRMYYSEYGPARVASLASQVELRGVDAWCVFDNTASGAATLDALRLNEKLR